AVLRRGRHVEPPGISGTVNSCKTARPWPKGRHMRRPFAPGTPVDARRYKRWIANFGSYRGGITNPLIEGWFGNFDDDDEDLAARVLDVVEYYGHIQIHAAYRQALRTLPGWHKLASKRVGKWRFAAMSGSAGESGDAMLHHFRVANELDKREFNPL